MNLMRVEKLSPRATRIACARCGLIYIESERLKTLGPRAMVCRVSDDDEAGNTKSLGCNAQIAVRVDPRDRGMVRLDNDLTYGRRLEK
jgi:hypothetical protein